MKSALILPPASPGSLGDEALVNAAAEYLFSKGIKVAIISYNNDEDWIGTDKISSKVEMKGYFGKSPQQTVNKIQEEFTKKIKDYHYFFCLGADVMDGFYSERDSLRRIELLKIADKCKVKATILGFSFNENPKESVVKELSQLPETIKIFMRDPVSYKRITERIKRKIELSADVAFLLKPKDIDIAEWCKEQKKEGRTLIGINANPKLMPDKQQELIQIYSDFVKEVFPSEKFSFLFIPHDYRDIPSEMNDLEIAQLLLKSLPESIKENSMVLTGRKTAAEIKSVAGLMDIVLSGRMHLAIAALGQGVPVCCVTYQGKFEGLFQHFGIKHVTIEPTEATKKGKLSEFFLRVLSNKQLIESKIKIKLPSIEKLAYKNFLHL